MVYHGEISLTFSGGVLKPDHRLDLPEGTRVRAVIRSCDPDPAAAEAAMATIQRISESGAFNSGGRTLTRDEMHERR